MRLPLSKLLLAACSLALLTPAWPAAAQSTGYVTGFPGKDPAGDEEIGWGPAYRPETSFSQPGTPLTSGEIAGRAYRARTGHGVYDQVEGPGPYNAVQDARGTRPVGFPSEVEPGAVPGRLARTHRASRSAVRHRRHAGHRATRQAFR
jgi:hypothetical protein